MRKYTYFFLLLIILTPIGLILPEVFNAGDAWGEWPTEIVAEHVGYVPKGMQKEAEIFNAPIPDYTFNEESDSLVSQSIYYILSAIIGVGFIFMLTFIFSKWIARAK